jgi:hypothetical protein
MSYSRRKSALRWKSTINKKMKASSSSDSGIDFDCLDMDYIWPGLLISPDAAEDTGEE